MWCLPETTASYDVVLWEKVCERRREERSTQKGTTGRGEWCFFSVLLCISLHARCLFASVPFSWGSLLPPLENSSRKHHDLRETYHFPALVIDSSVREEDFLFERRAPSSLLPLPSLDRWRSSEVLLSKKYSLFKIKYPREENPFHPLFVLVCQ